MRSCPVDGEALSEVMIGDLAIEVCGECGGKWFDNGKLSLLTKQGPRAMAQLDADYPATSAAAAPLGSKGCPACQGSLAAFSFKHTPGVVLEGCKGCKGIWVDHGRLTELAVKLGLPPDQVPRPARVAQPAAPTEVRCPQCQAVNKPTDQKCWNCSASLVPEAPSCPRCQEALTDTERQEVELRVCESCGGVWLDEPSLMDMFAYHMNATGSLDTSPHRREEDLHARGQSATCPNCKTGMLEHDFIAQLEGMYNVPTGIRADRCTTCNGMWFDVGELSAVQQAVAEYRASKEDEPPAFSLLGDG